MVMTENVSENNINLVSRKMCIEQIANVLKIGPDFTIATEIFGPEFMEGLSKGALDGKDAAGTYNRALRIMITQLEKGHANEEKYKFYANAMIGKSSAISHIITSYV